MTRRNVMWPFLIMAVGAVWLLMVAGAVPEAAGDLLLRAWPALLVLFGFDVLLGRRQIRIARLQLGISLVGLVATLALLAAVIWFAYQKQADVLRTDQVRTFSETLGPGVTRVRLELDVARTSIAVTPAVVNPRELAVVFTGSEQSRVETTWAVEGETGILRLSESYSSRIPRLEDYGRGSLVVTLPPDVRVELLSLRGQASDMAVDLLTLRTDRIELSVDRGDLSLTLPSQDILAGALLTGSGTIDVFVPRDLRLILKAEGGSGDFRYPSNYELLADGTLKHEAGEPYQYSLDVRAGGVVTVAELP